MLKYLIGDATSPMKKPAIIAHIVNDIGLMGSGFVVPLYTKNPHIKEAYLHWYEETRKKLADPPMELGEVQLLDFEEDVMVANMVAQHETLRTNPHPISYEALKTCLQTVYKYAAAFNLTVHMPRIATNRARGSWNIVEDILNKIINIYNVDTYIYTLKSEINNYKKVTYDEI